MEATLLMAQAFPELKRACGFVDTVWGEDQHWWCKTPDSQIVDPTKSQFPIVFGYEEVDPANPHRKIPTGVCMDCGDDAFDYKTFCSERCELKTLAYFNSGRL